MSSNNSKPLSMSSSVNNDSGHSGDDRSNDAAFTSHQDIKPSKNNNCVDDDNNISSSSQDDYNNEGDDTKLPFVSICINICYSIINSISFIHHIYNLIYIISERKVLRQ